MVDVTARWGWPVSRIVPVLTAAEAVKLVPDRRDRVGQFVERPGLSRMPCSRPSAPGTRPMARVET